MCGPQSGAFWETAVHMCAWDVICCILQHYPWKCFWETVGHVCVGCNLLYALTLSLKMVSNWQSSRSRDQGFSDCKSCQCHVMSLQVLCTKGPSLLRMCFVEQVEDMKLNVSNEKFCFKGNDLKACFVHQVEDTKLNNYNEGFCFKGDNLLKTCFVHQVEDTRLNISNKGFCFKGSNILRMFFVHQVDIKLNTYKFQWSVLLKEPNFSKCCMSSC